MQIIEPNTNNIRKYIGRYLMNFYDIFIFLKCNFTMERCCLLCFLVNAQCLKWIINMCEMKKWWKSLYCLNCDFCLSLKTEFSLKILFLMTLILLFPFVIFLLNLTICNLICPSTLSKVLDVFIFTSSFPFWLLNILA